MSTSAKFSIGQLVHHRLFDYRGVVYDLDPDFRGTDEWYEQMARSRPPKDEPWYRVLVDGGTHETYVAERNLEADASLQPIRHPYVAALFGELADGFYTLKKKAH